MRSFIFIFLITFTCHSQDVTYFKDQVNQIENELSNVLENREYIIFGTRHKMNLIVKKNSDFYRFIFINTENNIKLYDVNVLKNNCLDLVFNKVNYIKGIVDANSRFYEENPIETIIGDPFYFSYNLSYKDRYCEYFLTTTIKPSPIQQQVNNYLGSLIIIYPYNCDSNTTQ